VSSAWLGVVFNSCIVIIYRCNTALSC